MARQCFLELLVEPDAPLPQVYCEMSLAEYHQGNVRTALTFSEAGEKLLVSQPTPDPDLLARLRNYLVSFYREVGDVSRAITVGRQWLDGMGEKPATFRRGQIYYNLALALRQRAGPHDKVEALRNYNRARIDFQQVYRGTASQEEQERCCVSQVMALQNEAWLLCEMGDLEQAQEYAGLAAKLLSLTDGALQSEQVLLAAYLAYSHSSFTECTSLLHDLQLYAGKASARQQFWTEWLAARISLLSNQKVLADAHSALAAAEADRTKEVYLMRLAAELEREIKTAS